jgi:carboxymethylenebutenolidase
VVNLYGDTAATPDQLAGLKANEQILLGIFGAEDQSIPPETVNVFETALYDAEVMHRVTVYPGVGHAFVQPEAIRNPGPAREAWLEIRDFFKETLQQ